MPPRAVQNTPRWAPTPLPALELPELPTELHFVRDHFPVPAVDYGSWRLTLDGAHGRVELSLDAIKSLPRRTHRVVLECAGHRRNEMTPTPGGLPWGAGAVAEACWTGAGLSALLGLTGIPRDAREVVLHGADSGEFEGLPGRHHFARSLPLEKALDRDVLLAYEMNGSPIGPRRGGPVRAIVPGWYATDAVKWLDRIWFVSEPFDGAFQAHDYRLLEPGEDGPGRRMTDVPVHALITAPTAGDHVQAGTTIVRGIAWGGQGGIERVQVRVDQGPWRQASLSSGRGRYARIGWQLAVELEPGEHEFACRAIDSAGHTQPNSPPSNVQGYGNNAVHRLRLSAADRG